MPTYRELREQNNDLVIIACGFNWPAMLVAPFWALSKQFWPALAASIAFNLGMKLAMSKAYDADLNVLGDGLFVLLLGGLGVFGYYANSLLTAYYVAKGWKIVSYIEAESAELAATIANDPARVSSNSKTPEGAAQL